MSETPEQFSAEVSERIELASQVAAAGAEAAPLPNTLPKEIIEAEVNRILGEKAKEATSSKPAPEPDWKTLTELEATDLRRNLNIPVIVHEVPAYMDIQLADNEYVAVWANR